MQILVYASVRLFGESLAACLRASDRVATIEVKHNAEELAGVLGTFDADVILFDVTRKRDLHLVRQLLSESPRTPLVAMAVPSTSTEVIACADAGFVSYVPRNAPLSELVGILEMAIHGEARCDPRITRSLFEEIHSRSDGGARERPSIDLTPREIETMGLVSRGLSNKEIAGEMQIRVATVKNHVHSVLVKLRLTRRAEVSQLVADQPWVLLGGSRKLHPDHAVAAEPA